MKVGLIGNPNCGKTTVFNALTGACQQVGNWPGVTIEKKTGCFKVKNTSFELIDLPGVYSLTLSTDGAGIDERIACEFILNRNVDVILNIVDAGNLERHLYLTLQLLEMGVPIIVGLNMMDAARQRGIKIDIKKLSKELGCPVVPIVARSGEGVEELKQMLVGKINDTPSSNISYPELIQEAIDGITTLLSSDAEQLHAFAAESENNYKCLASLILFEGEMYAEQLSPETLAKINKWKEQIATTLGEDPDILIADARYKFIEDVYKKCITKHSQSLNTWTTRIDSLVLNRLLGIPIFLGVMYALFFFAINVGGAFQDFFDITSNTIFVEGLGHGLSVLGVPNWLVALLANGIGKGINTVLTFIPVIGAMFLGLAFLEDSGYMARAAFIVDRFMQTLGLPGKSFVPMIVGFGCNVPAVMAARTLESQRDRILTVMMTPFMSCSARLAIYAVFTAAFFPSGGQNIVFGLYLLGILMAILTGWLLRKTVLQGKPSPFIMELPPYHRPTFRVLLRHAWQRLSGFVWRAGKLILPICILLGVLNALNIDGTLNTGESGVHSILSHIGQWLTPLFSPMGIHIDNWPATVGLVTGILAKEVVVGTLNSLYGQMGQLAHASVDTFNFWGNLKAALISIPENLSQLGGALINPVMAKAPVHTLNQSVYGVMSSQFAGTMSAVAYLLFVLLYFPCISTVAAMSRELNRYWAAFSVIWTTGLAYVIAVTFYQVTTFIQHPVFSEIWLSCAGLIILLTVIALRSYLAGARAMETRSL